MFTSSTVESDFNPISLFTKNEVETWGSDGSEVSYEQNESTNHVQREPYTAQAQSSALTNAGSALRARVLDVVAQRAEQRHPRQRAAEHTTCQQSKRRPRTCASPALCVYANR